MKVSCTVGSAPIKMWTEPTEIEPQAMAQLENVAKLPFVFHHVAVMPDVHYGKGATVGTVLATERAIVPAAVGVDIGCGMYAINLGCPSSVLDGKLHELRSAIEKAVPVGFNQHNQPSRFSDDWSGWSTFKLLPKEVQDRFGKAQCQIGTLGGGNHFIEICLDTEDKVWMMLHSGSRNIGKEIAEVHINKAKSLMKQYMISLPDPDLAYLVEGTDEFNTYWKDLQWAQEYARINRVSMAEAILDACRFVLGAQHLYSPFEVNCHHNYAEMEHHFGQNVYVTRKGAVRARTTDYGIIPGSMGTKSYIVKGLGNADSFNSCSHGAGRRMSRGAANKLFTLEDVAKQTTGVECKKDASVIDELPGAYKDIEIVMKNQKDLVEIVATLKQVLCVKG